MVNPFDKRFLDKIAGQMGYRRKSNRIIPISIPDWWASSTAPHEFDLAADTEAYAKIHTVNICVRRISDAISALPIRFYKGEQEQREELFEGEFAELFYKPNIFDSYIDFWTQIVGFLLLTGNAYIALEGINESGTKPPDEMFVLPSHRVKIKPAADSFVGEYEYHVNNKVVTYRSFEVIHIKHFNPLSDYYGLSLIEPAKIVLITDLFARIFNRNFFRQGARPGGYLTTEDALDEEQTEQIRQNWQSVHGGVTRMHKTAILQKGMKYEPLTVYKDIAFADLMRLSREEILSVFGVPPAIAGIFEYANYANAREQKGMFYRDTIIPTAERCDAKFNTRMLDTWWPGVWCRHDASDVEALQEPLEPRVRAATTAVDKGVMTVNEARTRLMGLDRHETPEADELRQPVTAASFGLSAPAPEQGKLIDDPKRTMRWLEIDARARSKEPRIIKMMSLYFVLQNERVLDRLRDKEPKGFNPDDDGGREVLAVADTNRLRFAIAPSPENVVATEPVTKDADILLSELFDTEEEARLLLELMGPEIERLIKEAGSEAFRLLDVEGVFDITNPKVAEFLAGKKFKFTDQVVRRSRELVRGVLLDADAEGASIQRTAELIAEVLGRHVDYRARRIARTETISAHNAGAFYGYEQSGVVEKKEWLTARDAHVRLQHAEADGEIVGLNEFFVQTGESLRFPGDPAGSPGNVINCRCAVTAVVVKQE